jgi:hypothetical protein
MTDRFHKKAVKANDLLSRSFIKALSARESLGRGAFRNFKEVSQSYDPTVINISTAYNGSMAS